jgi:hypothetical protein
MCTAAPGRRVWLLVFDAPDILWVVARGARCSNPRISHDEDHAGTVHRDPARALPQAALAQATTFQTFVSAQRSDANACTLLAPCRTFAAAQARTTAGGIIDVLDVAATAQSPSTSLDRLPRWAREHGRMSWCCRRAPMRAAIRPASAAAIVASGLALPKLTGHPRQEALARPRTFDVTHEIAHDFDLMRVIGRDFNVSELIFDE